MIRQSNCECVHVASIVQQVVNQTSYARIESELPQLQNAPRGYDAICKDWVDHPGTAAQPARNRAKHK